MLVPQHTSVHSPSRYIRLREEALFYCGCWISNQWEHARVEVFKFTFNVRFLIVNTLENEHMEDLRKTGQNLESWYEWCGYKRPQKPWKSWIWKNTLCCWEKLSKEISRSTVLLSWNIRALLLLCFKALCCKTKIKIQFSFLVCQCMQQSSCKGNEPPPPPPPPPWGPAPFSGCLFSVPGHAMVGGYSQSSPDSLKPYPTIPPSSHQLAGWVLQALSSLVEDYPQQSFCHLHFCSTESIHNSPNAKIHI